MLANNKDRRLFFWNGLVILSIGFLSIYLPLQVIGVVTYSFFISVYYFATLIMALDFFIHLRGFITKSKNKNSGNELPLLLVDAIAAIPILVMSTTPWIQLLQLFKLIRIKQLLEKAMEHVIRWKRVLTITFFLFWLVFAIHWLSCGWLAIIGLDTAHNDYTNYVKSLYWVITTLTTVGYGDITPSTNGQMWYAMMIQLLGIGGFGYLLAQIVNIVSKKDPVETQYTENMELLSTTIKHRNLPEKLQNRILEYYRYMRKEKIGYDESSFLSSLPRMLQTEVAINLRKEFIREIPLFNDAGDSFLSEIAMKLELMIATPDDYFFKVGEKGDEMYLIVSGEVEVLNKGDNSVLATLSGGDYFGEIALFDNTLRNASVRASKFCNLYRLKKETFDEVIAGHPQIAADIEEKARMRGKR